MNLLVIVKLILVVSLCIFCSLSDLIRNIIPNRVLFAYFCVGASINVFCWIKASYLWEQLIGIGLLWSISIILYIFRIWAAGDCKLLMVLAILIPYETYIQSFNPLFSPILSVVFAFALSYIYLIVDSVYYSIKRKKIISKNNLITGTKTFLIRYISNLSYITMIDLIIRLVFPYFFTRSWILIAAINICTILLLRTIKPISSYNKFIVPCLIVICLILKIVSGIQVITVSMIIHYLIVLAAMLLRLLISEYNYEEINTSDVKKGMILSMSDTMLFVNSKIKGLPMLSTEDLRSRLTDEEANSVVKWGKSKYGKKTVKIVRKTPFAIFISLGVIIFVTLGVFIS